MCCPQHPSALLGDGSDGEGEPAWGETEAGAVCWARGSSGAVDICCWKLSITEAAAGSGISGLKGEWQERSALGCDSDFGGAWLKLRMQTVVGLKTSGFVEGDSKTRWEKVGVF